MGEMARGALAPSTPPVWERHVLNARVSPLITCVHHEYENATIANGKIMPADNLSKFNPPLPLGFYGNVLGYPTALTTTGKLRQKPLLYVIELVKQAKAKVQRGFGWGKAEFGRPANGWEIISFYIPSKNKEGEEGIVVLVCLPAPVMERFVKELDRMLKDNATAGVETSNSN
ncbi:hypothetical protein CRYUN_Cryun05aG0051400 [Craigia yunnanensis]